MPNSSGTNEMSGSTHIEHDHLKSLGKYQIKKKLGAGGMGTVFLAIDQQLNRTVALKVLPKDRAENPTLVKRFKSEAKAAAQLEHKHIVRIYDTGEIDGFLYIALEYIDGIDVHDLVVKRGVIPAKRSRDIVRQVALALEHASAKQIVHRDIKPANLMIKRDGTVKLADMGLARAVDDSQETGITRAGMTVGTVDYMSPEQARSSKSADVRSDIYSLGCTWYHMLTGSPPFSEGSMTTKLQAHSAGKRPDPRSMNPAVPEAYVAVIHRMMARQPQDRYQTARELLDDLELLSKQSSHINAEVMEALAAESDTGSRKERQSQSSGALPVLPPKEKFKPVDLTTGSKLNLDLIRYAIPALLVIAVLVILFWATQQSDDAFSGGAAANGVGNPYSSREEEPAAAVADEPSPDERDGASSDAVNAEPNQLSGLFAPDEPFPPSVVAVPFPGAEDSRTTSDGVRLLPNWVSHFRTPPKTARQSIIVTRTPNGESQVSRLNQALAALKRNGGVIQLDGEGPFSLDPANLNTEGEVRLTATEGSSPVINLSAEALKGGQDSFVNVRTSRLVIENLHFVLVDPPHDLTLINVAEGDLSLQNCSFTVSGSQGIATTAISLQSLPRRQGAGPQNKEATGRCLLENVIFHGDQLTAVRLLGKECELVAGNCLISAGDAPAIELSDAAVQGRPAEDDTAQRRIRLLASTLASNQSVLRFVHDAGTSFSAPCEVVTKESLLVSTSRPDASASATMVSFVDWSEKTSNLGSSRAQGVEWSTDDSRFLGWPTLVTMTSADAQTTTQIANADEWRRFWNKPLSSDTFLQEPLSIPPTTNDSDLDLTSLSAAIAEAVVTGSGDVATGYRVGDLSHVPLGLIDHVVAAANVPVEPDWLGLGMQLDDSPIVREMTRKTDISRVLRSRVCQDGSHMIFSGSGLHEITPILIKDKSIRVEFRSSGSSPLILQVETNRGKDAPLAAAFNLQNATLDMVGAQIKIPASTSDKQPQWLFALDDASLSLRGCTIERSSAASESHAGLLKFSEGEQAAPQSPRSVLIENSFLRSPGQLLSGNIRWESLVLRNNVFVTQGDFLDLTLDTVGLQRRPAVVMEHCTCSGNLAAIRLRSETMLTEDIPRLRMFVTQSLFVGAAGVNESHPTVIARDAESTTRSHVVWWGNANAYATTLADYLQTTGAERSALSFKEQWISVWGSGHEVNALTAATDVIFEASFPDWTELESQSFKLSDSGRASKWGRDKSGTGAILDKIGSTQSVGGQGAPDTDSPQAPSVPRKRRGGF